MSADPRTAPTLSRRLTLEAPGFAADGAGGSVTTWTPLGEHWAEVRATFAAERFAGDAEASRVTHRIVVRWAPPGHPARPLATQRFRDGARTFAILGVAEADPRNRFLACWTVEEASA